jgi:hypothetical protein
MKRPHDPCCSIITKSDLGNVALRCGEKFTYDFRTGKCSSDKANALLKREPRKGWEFGYA